MPTLCICHICTCGLHKCPHSPQPPPIPSTRSASPCVLTEYHDSFNNHATPVRRSSMTVRKETKQLKGEIAQTTTFRADYVPHKVTKRQPKAAWTYNAPDGIMLLKSTYMMDFRPVTTHRLKFSAKKEKYSAPKVKMDVQTVYQEVYQCWVVARPEPFQAIDNLKVNPGQFNMTTTFQDDFCPKTKCEDQKSFRPPQKIQEPLPFEGTTNYRQVYVVHRLQCKPPTKKQVVCEPNSVHFNGESLYKQDFRGVKGEVTKSCKPKLAWEACAVPFEDCTEFQKPATYQQRKMSEKYSPPKGDMDLISWTHGDYDGLWGQRALSLHPPIKAWCKGKPFEECSAMKDDYLAWKVKEYSRVVHKGQINLPSGAFETTTTVRSDYTAKSFPETSSFKPTQRAMSTRVMDDTTVYRTSYIRGEIKPCPASFTDPPGFEYRGVSNRGHLLYRTASPGQMGKTRPATANATSSKTSHVTKISPSSALLHRDKIVY